MSDDYEYDDWDDDGGDILDACDDCSGFFDDGIFMCGAAGSEQCEFECPYNRDIGKTMEMLDDEPIDVEVSQ